MTTYQMRQFQNESLNKGIENLDQNSQNLIDNILNMYESTDTYDVYVVDDIAQSLLVIIKLSLKEFNQENLNENKKQFFNQVYEVIQKYSQDQIPKDQLVQEFLKIEDFRNVFDDLEQYKKLADEINEIFSNDEIGGEDKQRLQKQLIDQQLNNPGYLEIFVYLISESEIKFESKNQDSQDLSHDLTILLDQINDQSDQILRQELISQYNRVLNDKADKLKSQHEELVFYLQQQFYEILKQLKATNRFYLGDLIQNVLKKFNEVNEKKRVLEFITMCFAKIGQDGTYSDKYIEILKNEIQHNEFNFENDVNNVSKYLIYDYFRFINQHQDNMINDEKLDKLLNHLTEFFNFPQENLITTLPSIIVARTNILTENNLLLMHQILGLALQFRNISNVQSLEKFNQFIDSIPTDNIKDIYIPIKLIIVSLLAGNDINITFKGDKMPQTGLYKDVLQNEQNIERVLLQLYAMKNTYILSEYDPIVYMQFLKDNTFNLSKLNLQRELVSKPILLFNDDQRGLFGDQEDLMQTTDNLVKVIAGTSQEIIDQKILNENEEQVIVQFIEENGIQEYSDEENEYENVYVIVRNSKSPCFKKN